MGELQGFGGVGRRLFATTGELRTYWIFILLAVQLFGLYSFLCVRGVKIGAVVLKF